MKIIRNFFNFINFKSQLKNIIIFVPLALSNKDFEGFGPESFFYPLLIFFIITNIVYITNDFSDKKIDKKNKTKINIQNIHEIKASSIIAINLSLLILFLLIYETVFFSIHLLIYIFSFYIYNFFTKKIKFIDTIFLTNFYLQRIFYGADIYDIEISNIFIIFFSTLFFILSFSKRYTQIYLNKLTLKNKIISYDMNDLKNLKYIIITLIFLNFLSLSIYLLQTNSFIKHFDFLFSYHSNLQINYNHYILSGLYVYCLVDLIFNLFKQYINRDFYIYAIKSIKYTSIVFLFFIYTLLTKII